MTWAFLNIFDVNQQKQTNKDQPNSPPKKNQGGWTCDLMKIWTTFKRNRFSKLERFLASESEGKVWAMVVANIHEEWVDPNAIKAGGICGKTRRHVSQEVIG